MSEARSSGVIPPELVGEHSIRAYDFLHPERLSRRQLRALESVHREASGAMANRLTVGERQADVQLEGIVQLGAQEFVAGLPRPTIILLLSLEPLSVSGILQLDTALGLEIVNVLMGGRRHLETPDRLLTDMENAVLREPVESVLECLSQAWQRLGALELRAASVPDAPHFGLLGQPQDPVLVAGFRVVIGAATGGLTVGVPLVPLERSGLLNLDRLESGPHAPDSGMADAAAVVGSLPVTCSAQIADVAVTLADLRDLDVGDVLMLCPVANAGLELVVSNGRRLPARLISERGRIALELLP